MSVNSANSIAKLPGTAAFEELVKQAEAGNTAVLPELRALLDERPEIWRKVGDLASQAENAVLGLVAGNHLLLRESIRRKMQELRSELSESTPSPLERLLIDRIVLAWAQLHFLEIQAIGEDRGATLIGVHAQRRQNAAQQRYLAAVKQLALVRKLVHGTRPYPKGEPPAGAKPSLTLKYPQGSNGDN